MLHASQQCALWALPAIAVGAFAQDGIPESGESADEEAASSIVEYVDIEPVRCLSLPAIRRTEIIDDSTIVFEMRARDIYVNQLPRNCPGLKRSDRFMYELHTARLCDSDTITVLERMGGIGTTRGFTCRLGEFYPSSKGAVALLKEGLDGRAGAAVEVNPIELPPAEDEAPADNDGE